MMTRNNGVTAYLLLGSNVGDRSAHLATAAKELEEHFDLLTASHVYETDAWGDRSQEPYLNQALLMRVELDPVKLHAVTRAIEKKMGRTDKGNYKPRKIDIDILFYGDEIIKTTHLTIPHPRIQMRRFVLAPLAEIDEDLMHPVFNKTIAEMLKDCKDQLEVRIFIDGNSPAVSQALGNEEPGTRNETR